MGLDMYLYKAPKIEGMHFKTLMKCDNDLDEIIEQKGELYEALKPYIKEKGQYVRWKSVLEDLGYWRKANHIHGWFVNNVQGGEDRCDPHPVTKEHLEELLSLCQEVKRNKKSAGDKLPTTSGFFFGGNEYDEFYHEDIKLTIEIIKNVLKNVDFDKNYVVYCSSW